MSADLLRRAAAKLRQSAVPLERVSGDWHPVITDSESLTGVRHCPDHDASGQESFHACDDCHVMETYSERLAAYVSLLHPPVALALAEWLDDLALWGKQSPRAVAVARAVLREDGESE